MATRSKARPCCCARFDPRCFLLWLTCPAASRRFACAVGRYVFLLATTNVAKQYEKLTSKLASIQAFIEDVCGSGFGTALRLMLKSGQDDFIAKENDLTSLVQDYDLVRSRVKEESEGFVAEVERRGKAASARGAAATPQKNEQLEGLEQRRAAQASAVQRCEQELARAEAAAVAARAEQQARRDREERAAPVKQLKQTKRLRFDAKLRQKQREFHQGTRAWAFDELGAWLKTNSPKKLFWLKVGMCVCAALAVRRSVRWLTPPRSPVCCCCWLARALLPCCQGGAGSGKTAWSAEVVRRHAAQLAALHMCLHSDEALR